MTYDVQIDNEVRRGLTYAELITLPIQPDTFVRRSNSQWIRAHKCVELTHVINAAQPETPAYTTAPVYESEIGEAYGVYDDVDNHDIASDDNDYYDYEEEDDYEKDEDDYDEDDGYDNYADYADELEEQHVFVPTAEYIRCKKKRNKAIIGILSLGLSAVILFGIGNTWRSNIFNGTSPSKNAGMGFILKCLSFCLIATLMAIPYFIYSVFALIYYSIRLNNLKKR